MKPTFIYYNNLTFDDEKNFSTCMVCYIDLTVGITKLPNYAKIKQISDQANVILRSADFGYGRKELVLRKTSGTNLTF